MRNLTLDKIIPTRFDTVTYQEVTATAKQQQLSKAAFVRLAVNEYLIKAKEPLVA
jgi:hypothetical protein